MAALQGHPAQTTGTIVATADFFKSKANDKNLWGRCLIVRRMTRMLRESEGRRQGGCGGGSVDGRQRNRLILVCGLLLALEGRGAVAESAGSVAQRCLGQPGRASKSAPPCLSLRGGATSDALWATTTDPNSGKVILYGCGCVCVRRLDPLVASNITSASAPPSFRSTDRPPLPPIRSLPALLL